MNSDQDHTLRGSFVGARKEAHHGLGLTGGLLQVSGGSWCVASPVWPDFSMLPLLSKPSGKWGRWGSTTL